MEGSKVIVQNYIFDTILDSQSYDDEDGHFSSYYLKEDESVWMQLTTTLFNVFYPFDKEPEDKLDELGISLEGLEISSWAKGVYLTIEFKEDSIVKMSEFICLFFLKCFSLEITNNSFDYISFEDYPEDDIDEEYFND